MQHILYNIRFRQPLLPRMLDLFMDHGIITGSSIMNTAKDTVNGDIDIAVLCSSNFVECFHTVLSIPYTNATYNIKDAAQHIFDLLIKNKYALYIKNSYRDSTFLSCYVTYNDQLYNLLLMDEENVFAEWVFATQQLFMARNNPDLFVKYNRIKFFEQSRKCFRRTLKSE